MTKPAKGGEELYKKYQIITNLNNSHQERYFHVFLSEYFYMYLFPTARFILQDYLDYWKTGHRSR